MSEPKTITVRDLIAQINEAIQHMSRTNPHRRLLIHCGRALVELAVRSGPVEPPPPSTEEVVQ